MDNDYFDKLKKKILEERGFNLSFYSEGYVRRRINTRILDNELSLDSFREYIEILDSKPEEYTKLFDEFSINVTEFFRDRVVWEKLYNQFLPPLIEGKLSQRIPTLRIWSIGCSTGEEPYSIAIMVKELLDKKRVRTSLKKLLMTILATDIDKNALNKAEKGIYPAQSLKNVDKINPGWLRKYFSEFQTADIGQKYQISDEIKNLVTFRQHNFISDESYKSMDIISFRNVIIYFTSKIKDKLMQKLYKSLMYHGFLVLGKSELIFTWGGNNYFYPVDSKEHIYRRERRSIEKQISLPAHDERRKNWWCGSPI